jgi:hypothetical protein
MSSYKPTSPTCSPENNCTDVEEIYHRLLNRGAVSPFSYQQPVGTVTGSIQDSRLRKDAPYPMDRRVT